MPRAVDVSSIVPIFERGERAFRERAKRLRVVL